MFLAGFTMLSVPTEAQSHLEEAERQDSAIVGAFKSATEHLDGRYSLYRTRERVYAVLSTRSSPVQLESGQRSEPLFVIPPGYRLYSQSQWK